MNIVLFGKNGQLGWELQRLLPAFGALTVLDREELDLANPAAVRDYLLAARPNLIVNASAYTEVDQAEKVPDLALAINAEAPGVMAEAARELGAGLVHYSTDYVFDGAATRPYAESDPTHPLNVYGQSKLAGEQAIQAVGGAYFIFRTSWVYSLRGNGFVNKVLGWARKNTTLKVVSDQVGSPTWARMLAEHTLLALTPRDSTPLLPWMRDRSGLYHLTGAGYTSRFEWAKAILARDPKRTEQLVQAIEPALTSDFPTPAVRPLFSALDCAKFTQTFTLPLPHWTDSLTEAMREPAN
jgi:dTDP-4-dehydrorhamnose reductase